MYQQLLFFFFTKNKRRKYIQQEEDSPLPDYPQTTVDKVASVIELDFVYLIVCLSANIIISLLILLCLLWYSTLHNS